MRTNALLFACFTALAGCGAAPIDSSDDPELSGAIDDGKADSAYSTSTYYTLRPDLRRCAYPMCGGTFVARVNRTTTKCIDGAWASECRVLDTDFSALHLTDAELSSFSGSAIVVRGTLKPTVVNGSTYSILKVSEVWKPATSTAGVGTFYRVTDRHIQCFAAPCPGQHEAKLNSTISANIAGFELSGSDATAEQQYDANQAVFGSSPILVVGDNVTVTGPAGKAQQLAGNQFYLQVKHTNAQPVCAAGEYLDVTGACGAADLPGTCKAVPQLCYQIYKPVCGCNGKTYSNECTRLAAKVQLDHAGECAGNTP
jgi:hypothetical protein